MPCNLLLEARLTPTLYEAIPVWSPLNCHIPRECVFTLGYLHCWLLLSSDFHTSLGSPLPISFSFLSCLCLQRFLHKAPKWQQSVCISWALSPLKNRSNYHSHDEYDFSILMKSKYLLVNPNAHQSADHAILYGCLTSTLISTNTSATTVSFILPQKLLLTFNLLQCHALK